ncbi:Proteasome activator complex subunit 4 C-terminal domain-containing protein [Entamoeba marina]
MQIIHPDPIQNLWNVFLDDYTCIIPALQNDIHNVIFGLNAALQAKDYTKIKHLMNFFEEFLYSGVGLTNEELKELFKFTHNALGDFYYYKKQQKVISLIVELILCSIKVKGLFGVSDTTITSFTSLNDCDQIFGKIHQRESGGNPLQDLKLDYRPAFERFTENSDLSFSSGFLVSHFKTYFDQNDIEEILQRIELFPTPSNGLQQIFMLNSFTLLSSNPNYIRRILDQWQNVYTSEALDYFFIVLMADFLSSGGVFDFTENDISFIFNRINHDLFYEFNGGDGMLDGVNSPFKGLVLIRPDEEDYMVVAALLIILLIEREDVKLKAVSPILMYLRTFFESVHRSISGDADGMFSVVLFLKGLVVHFKSQGLCEKVTKESIQHFVTTIFKSLKPLFFAESLPVECKDIIRWLLVIDGKTLSSLVKQNYSQIIACKPDDHHLHTFLVVVSLFIEILPSLIDENNPVALEIISLVFQLHRLNPTNPDINSIMVDLISFLSKRYYLIDSPPSTVQSGSVEYNIFVILPDLFVEFFTSFVKLLKEVSNFEAYPFTNEFYNSLEIIIHFDSTPKRIIEEKILTFINETTSHSEPLTIILGILVYYSTSFNNKLVDLIISRLINQTPAGPQLIPLSENEIVFCLTILNTSLSYRTDFNRFSKSLFLLFDTYNTNEKMKIKEKSLDCCKKICALSQKSFTLPIFVPTYPIRFHNYYDLSKDCFIDPKLPYYQEFYQQVFDKYVYNPFERLNNIFDLPNEELILKKKEILQLLKETTPFIEAAATIYDIRGHSTDFPAEYECIKSKLYSNFKAKFTWDQIGEILLKVAQKIRQLFQDSKNVIAYFLPIIRAYLKKQSNTYEPCCISFLIHSTQRSYSNNFMPIIFYEQATTLLFQLQSRIYGFLASPTDIDVLVEEQLLSMVILDSDFHEYVNHSIFFNSSFAKQIILRLIENLPQTLTQSTVRSYVYSLKVICTYLSHLSTEDFPIFYDVVSHFLKHHLADSKVFSSIPLTSLISQFGLVVETSPIHQLPPFPEEFLSLLYQGCESHPLVHRFLYKLVTAYLLQTNVLPPSFIKHSLYYLTQPLPHPKRYGSILRCYLKNTINKSAVAIVSKNMEKANRMKDLESKYNEEVLVINEDQILKGTPSVTEHNYIFNYTTKHNECARFLVSRNKWNIDEQNKELLYQFVTDKEKLRLYITLLGLIQGDGVIDEEEEEGKFICLNDYVFLLRLMNIFGASVARTYIEIIEESLEKEKKEEFRSAVVLFQIVVEGLQNLSFMEFTEIENKLLHIFEKLITQQYEDVYAYVNRLHALFSCRTDPRIINNFIQLASKKTIPNCFYLSFPFALETFVTLLKNPIEQLIDSIVAFGSKMLLSQLIYPELFTAFMNTIESKIKELPINQQDDTNVISLPQQHKILCRIFYPGFDQAIVIHQHHLTLIYLLFDKILTFSQSTHSVMEDVVDIFTSFSTLHIHPTCFGDYLQHLLDLITTFFNNQNALSLILRLVSVTIYVHMFQMSQQRIQSVLNVTFSLLRSNQTQIRLLAYDLLYCVIDTFHPIDYVIEQINSIRSIALQQNVVENQHAYILLCSSLIASYKTEIPEFLVKILVDFASTNFSAQVCVASKKLALSDFWDNHKDMWDVYYAPLFTNEERSLLKEENTPLYII